MRAHDLKIGNLYRISNNPNLDGSFGVTPLEEASRLSIFVLNRASQRRASQHYAVAEQSPGFKKLVAEPLIFLGLKEVYGGKNGDLAKYEMAYRFVRTTGKGLYIFSDHIKHIEPFTAE